MVDLPQHAGQIVLLRDILLGNSSWAEFFHINLLTPYLTAYALALPLSLFLPITVVLKLLLSIAYIAFVFMCIQIRKHVGADPRVDWLFLLSFFGFAYNWGFFTYLVATPIGLAFILLAMKYADKPSIQRGVLVAATGTLLLVSHGLVFLFAWGVGVGLLVCAYWKAKYSSMAALPFTFLIGLCLGSYFLNISLNEPIQSYLPSGFYWGLGLSRIPKAFLYSLLANPPGISAVIVLPAMLAFFMTPWLLGLRMNRSNFMSWVPLAVVLSILLFVPAFAFHTQFIYQRFSLFLIPAYAWLFTCQAAPRPVAKPVWVHGLVVPMLIVSCWSMLSLHSLRAWRFGQEAADFDRIMTAVQPKSRALALVYDRDSKGAGNVKIYTQYPAWYQAEQSGLVDFNFGWMPSLLVRYRMDHLPGVLPGFEWNPESFDWNKNRGDNYKYFFVRSGNSMPADVFKGASCRPKLISHSGSWQVYEQNSCSKNDAPNSSFIMVNKK